MQTCSYAFLRFLYHASVAGAEIRALVFSMKETARANRLNVFSVPFGPDHKDNLNTVELLLAWNDLSISTAQG